MRKLLNKKILLPESAWPYFSIFLLSNSLISYGSASLKIDLWIGLIGIALPLGMAFAGLKSFPISKDKFNKNFLILPPFWFWPLFITFALSIRFYGWWHIPTWPTSDESANAFFSMQLDKKWRSNLFFDYDNLPPLYFWLLAFFFKLVSPSLFSFWGLSRLISFITPFIGYWACRFFLSPALSFLWFLACALSFWPLFYAQLGMPPDLVPLWECLCIGLLGNWQKNPSGVNGILNAILLGLALGSGFYTFFNWFFFAFIFGLIFINRLKDISINKKKLYTLSAFSFSAFLMIFPLGLAYLRLPSNPYFKTISVFQDFGKFGFDFDKYFLNAGSIITALFWGTNKNICYFGYRPFWGGFLNPILGSFFFVGLILLVRLRNYFIPRWFFSIFVFLLIPAFLSFGNVECFRVITVLPFLFLLIAIGFQYILQPYKSNILKYVFLVFVWALSLGLDLHHLSSAFTGYWRAQLDTNQYVNQRCFFRANQILRSIHQKFGPGLVLTGFNMRFGKNPASQSLVMASHAFDAGVNSQLGFSRARWAALLIEDQDLVYLGHKFQGLPYYFLGLSPYEPAVNHRLFLFLIPITSENQVLLRQWLQADQFMENLTYQSLNLMSSRSDANIQIQLLGNENIWRADPFLEFHRWNFLAEEFESGKDYIRASLARKKAILVGLNFPLAMEYHQLGIDLDRSGKQKEALRAFLTSGRLNPSFMPPKYFLKRLARREKLHT